MRNQLLLDLLVETPIWESKAEEVGVVDDLRRKVTEKKNF